MMCPSAIRNPHTQFDVCPRTHHLEKLNPGAHPADYLFSPRQDWKNVKAISKRGLYLSQSSAFSSATSVKDHDPFCYQYHGTSSAPASYAMWLTATTSGLIALIFASNLSTRSAHR